MLRYIFPILFLILAAACGAQSVKFTPAVASGVSDYSELTATGATDGYYLRVESEALTAVTTPEASELVATKDVSTGPVVDMTGVSGEGAANPLIAINDTSTLLVLAGSDATSAIRWNGTKWLLSTAATNRGFNSTEFKNYSIIAEGVVKASSDGSAVLGASGGRFYGLRLYPTSQPATTSGTFLVLSWSPAS